jgi:uncharacterized NAD-dependent epimerase/dehydratase family protein
MIRNRILFTDGMLADRIAAKTAIGVLRFQPERVKAIVDARHEGEDLTKVCPWLDPEARVPIVARLDQVAQVGDELVVGFAPFEGRLDARQRAVLLEAVDAGVHVLNGLHDFLPPSELVTNLRAVEAADRVVAQGVDLHSVRILTVGTSHCVGKMTATVLLSRALRDAGVRADWVATGQTGVLIRGTGRVIDAIPVDFVPGVIERLVVDAERAADVVVVEGQGSLFHPSYSPSTFALLHASRPQYLVLCHRLGQLLHDDFRQHLPALDDGADAYLNVARAIGLDVRLLGVCLDTADAIPEAAAQACATAAAGLGVPCVDPVRHGVGQIVERFVAERPRFGAGAMTGRRS